MPGRKGRQQAFQMPKHMVARCFEHLSKAARAELREILSRSEVRESDEIGFVRDDSGGLRVVRRAALRVKSQRAGLLTKREIVEALNQAVDNRPAAEPSEPVATSRRGTNGKRRKKVAARVHG